MTEPEVFRRTRNRFNQWLQTEFDRHYHTMRDGGYRSFLKKNHPTELERYDEACEALRREEFARFAELQTLGLYLHLQVQQKEAQFRRRRNRLLLGMTITGVMTSVLLYANFYPEQLQLISHELATLPGRMSVLTSGERDFITVSDPACGAGGMIVAMAEAMLEAGFNPQKQMMVYCVDIDPVAAMMCYIQLSLMGIPAIVATGNSLTVAIKREMATPMFVLGHWHHRWQAERTRQAA